jgi:hypothetical protein
MSGDLNPNTLYDAMLTIEDEVDLRLILELELGLPIVRLLSS